MIGVTDGGFFTPAQKEAFQWQELQSGCHAPVVVYVSIAWWLRNSSSDGH